MPASARAGSWLTHIVMPAQAGIHAFLKNLPTPLAPATVRALQSPMPAALFLSFQNYIDALRKTPLDQKTEHSDRAALENLLNALKPSGVNIQHEPIRQGAKGSPDFKITKSGGILGYVEVKTIGENLDAILKSTQIKKYLTLSQNILVTDYLHFIWLHNGLPQQRENLAFATDLEAPKFKLNPDRAEAIAGLIQNFLSTAPEGIARAETLAAALATRAHLLRDGLAEELIHQEKSHTQGKLYGLLGAFRAQVFHDLTLAEFADAFAQTLAYGLFLACLNKPETLVLTLKNAPDHIPGAFPLIRELVDFLKELDAPAYVEIRWVVEEILSIMNTLKLADIAQDLTFGPRKSTMRKLRAGSEEEHRLFERDPFVYFYEDFLARYDAKLRKSRGVYYTPPPVVNFIIRAVDDILKSEFSIPLGLADSKRVTMLDFATGTGTFILEAFEKMFENIGPSHAKRDLLVREHFLKNIYGFEFLIAPYTIAHLKLSQYLKDKGHALAGKERLQVYLTNTLEPVEAQTNYLLPALSSEAEGAQAIKKKPILVITGNPPYSGHSKNKGAWISKKIDAYKFVDGAALGEKNPKWLSDDYVKFIRFAQDKIEQVPEGIVGIITNHSFLDNPTFRGMRQSLMKSFNKIYVIDLHGSAKKKIVIPEGSKDENVFDIEQGVSISLFVKNGSSEVKQVFRSDFFGSRLSKYQSCGRLMLNEVNWRAIKPTSPFYLFEKTDPTLEAEYLTGESIQTIFLQNVLGFQTHRDEFAIGFSANIIQRRIEDMRDSKIDDFQFKERYGVDDNRDWKLSIARSTISSNDKWKEDVILCAYRPFDERWCHFGPITMDYPRRELMKHVARRKNLTLQVSRQISSESWRHVIVADKCANDCLISNATKEANQVFPLYLYTQESIRPKRDIEMGIDDPFLNMEPESQPRRENISPTFRAELLTRYATPILTAEQIFGYIYAILHAPSYRTRYAEFLRGDFPRIPLPEYRTSFEALATLGWDLAQAHLLKNLPKHPVTYLGKGDNTVEKPRYDPSQKSLYINAGQYFAPISEEIWNFHIGGYQVLEKYLKSRKGRKLTLDEVTNIEQTTASLAFTLTQMQKIDQAYTTAFPKLFSLQPT